MKVNGHATSMTARTEVARKAVLVLEDGTVSGLSVKPWEKCASTSMTGYEEILTDPSFPRCDTR
jgi:hypothetical protein